MFSDGGGLRLADNKTYYYMKVNKDFFDDDTVKYLEEQEHGKDFVILYLKLCLKSLEDEGLLIRYVGTKLIPYDTAAIAKMTNTEIGIVEKAMKIFEEIELIEKKETGELFMSQIQEMIGTDTYDARRKRKQRAKDKILNDKETEQMGQCPTDVPQKSHACPMNVPEYKSKSIEIDIEKEQQLEQEEKNNVAGVGENIIFKKLKEAFGEMSVSGTMVTEVEDLLKVHGQALVLYALDETILNAGRSIRYTRSILERWKGQGLNTVEQIKQNQEARDQQKLKSKPLTKEEWRQSLKEPDPRYGF